MIVEKDRTYIGVVVNNKDPKRLGRCKVRVLNIFDDIPTDDIPWSSPWKDLAGNEFNTPDEGKVVTVVFESGNIYKPEFIYSNHFNVNLENKLKNLSEEDYNSMKSIFFDQSTQIYSNKSEGLKIDYEYTNINLDSFGNIQLNLRDNKSVITVGSKDADEEAVLGTTFMNWFDTLVESLLGTNGSAFIANGSPALASPDLIRCLQEYQDLRNNFVSEHVRICRNKNVIPQNRPYVNQKGDSWKSTVDENTITSSPSVEYSPSSKILDENGNEIDYEPLSASNGNPADYKPNDYLESVSYDIPTTSLDKSKFQNGRLPDSILRTSKWLNGDVSSRWIKSNVKGTPAAKLTADAAKAFDALFDLYNSVSFDGKAPLLITDGYRTYEQQVAVKRKRGDSAAEPGRSNHGWGLAVDLSGIANPIGSSTTRNSYKDSAFRTPTYQWLFQNGPKFGIYNPISLRDGNKLEEWWHFEYQGPIKPENQKPLLPLYSRAFTLEDANLLRSKGISFTPPKNLG